MFDWRGLFRKKKKIVSGVGVGVSPQASPLVKEMEQAMKGAVEQARRDGIPLTETDKIRERMMNARDSVLRQYLKQS